MNVAVIILTWNAAAAALACLRTVTRQERAQAHVLVVDNASTDGTPERIAEQFPTVTLIRNPRNLGFAAGMNAGIRALQAAADPPDVIVLLNQDTQVAPNWLAEIVAPFERDPQIGAVGCKIRYADGTIQHAGAYLEWPRALAQHVGWHEPDTGQYDDCKDYETLTGAALALRTQALEEVGLLDPGYTPAYYEDSDLCWRLRRHSYRIVYNPRAVVTHHESLSITDDLTRSKYYNRGRLRYVLKTYAVADIVGPFLESEIAFVHAHGYTIEARALRWAYIETLAGLPEILAARRSFYPELSADETTAVQNALLQMKDALTASLRERARRTIDEIRII